jgi:hypothetical protein
MKNISSIRMVYALVCILLFVASACNFWPLVIFIAVMLFIGSITTLCPSKWFFEKLGFGKSKL